MSEGPTHYEIEGGLLGREDVQAAIDHHGLPLRFIGVDFTDADLSRLVLDHCEFQRCTLLRTQFLGARLEGTQWKGCRGAYGIFEAAHLLEASFSNCDLNNTRWQRAKLAQVVFNGCKLTGANFSHCSSLGLSFNETRLNSAFLPGMSFARSTLNNLDFSEADLSDADFRKAEFVDCSLAHARINGATFAGADLRGADLSGFRLNDAKLFKGAVISRAQASMLLSELGLTVA
ncbi:pentapeptide repeat-containing protein [Pseudomonas silesiensis]|uniref:pentapeptide repeat-containing protein n=1 Tax=Pseudomonas silesiensis TaxID=1853130 RepID=UPI0034D3EBEF